LLTAKKKWGQDRGKMGGSEVGDYDREKGRSARALGDRKRKKNVQEGGERMNGKKRGKGQTFKRGGNMGRISPERSSRLYSNGDLE